MREGRDEERGTERKDERRRERRERGKRRLRNVQIYGYLKFHHHLLLVKRVCESSAFLRQHS